MILSENQNKKKLDVVFRQQYAHQVLPLNNRQKTKINLEHIFVPLTIEKVTLLEIVLTLQF